jgi:hypothetical protein
MKEEDKDRQKRLTVMIAECNAQAERLEREIEMLEVLDDETYLKIQRRRTSLILRLESLERRLSRKEPEGCEFLVTIPQHIKL